MANGKRKTYPKADVTYLQGVTVFLFAIVANLAAQLIISIVAEAGALVTNNSDFSDGSYFQLIAMLVLQLAFLAVPAVYFGVVKKTSPQLVAPLRKPHPSVALAIVLPVLTVCGFILPTSYFVNALYKLGYPPSSVPLDTPGQAILGVVAMVAVAPFVEELIFRGFLLSGLRKNFSPYIAALLSAIAFSLMHMSPEQTVYQFFLGYVCGLAAVQSGNLWAAVVVHAGNNAFSLLLDTRLGKPFNVALEFLTKTAWGAAISVVLLAIACSAAIWFICLAIRKLSARRQAKDTPNATTATAQSDTATASDESVQQETVRQKTATVQKHERKTGLAIYLAGIGLCAVLWVFVLAAGLTQKPAENTENVLPYAASEEVL
ncbi:MAG: CPBP family intramembrane metalloprotease [Clostridiales bacterium]|nr:CPBP family intramembrane metalloprotease [Clostridiales bacterium]